MERNRKHGGCLPDFYVILAVARLGYFTLYVNYGALFFHLLTDVARCVGNLVGGYVGKQRFLGKEAFVRKVRVCSTTIESLAWSGTNETMAEAWGSTEFCTLSLRSPGPGP